MPSLDDWEKQWKKTPQGIVKPAVVQVDFQVPADCHQQAPECSGVEVPVAAAAVSG